MTVVWFLHFLNKIPVISLWIITFNSGKLPCSIATTNRIQFAINCTEKIIKKYKLFPSDATLFILLSLFFLQLISPRGSQAVLAQGFSTSARPGVLNLCSPKSSQPVLAQGVLNLCSPTGSQPVLAQGFSTCARPGVLNLCSHRGSQPVLAQGFSTRLPIFVIIATSSMGPLPTI